MYERAVKADDQHALARQALAGVLASKNPVRAEILYEEALKLSDDDAPLLADYGTFLSKRGGEKNVKKAIQMMTRSLELDMSQQSLMYNLAYLHKKTKNFELSVRTLTKLLQRNPNHFTALGLLANIKASNQSGLLQNVQEARRLYERALIIAPNDSTNRKNYEIFLNESLGDFVG